VAAFEHAEAERQRLAAWLEQDYWRRLSGNGLELEVGALLEKLGHQVKRTGGAGDGGVDLLIDLDTVVQCKCHAGPASPSVVRDLLGTKTYLRAKRAILVSTGGVTSGAADFARQVEIEIWDAAYLVRLRKQVGTPAS
jgi:restriction endonuclease Mrr